MSEEKRYQIAVSLIPGVGDKIGKKLIAYFGSAKAIFERKDLEKTSTSVSKLLNNINKSEILKRADKELKFMEKEGIEMLFYTDKNYPFRLKQCDDSPLTVFYKGKNKFNAEKIISIVGTRNATNEGKQFCEKIVAELSKYNPVIVSGLAYGIDICAHKAALKNNLHTWGVLAHGLDRIYPNTHSKVAAEMINNGALITDYLSETNPDRQNFPSRNRIVAGLSDATIVIESAKKGGSLITANIANSYNREVFAVPGKPKNSRSSGCNFLIKTQRAVLLENIEDIVRELNWDLPKNKNKKEILIKLTKEERKIISVLEEGLHIDKIVKALKWDSSKVAQMLLQLEFKGVLISLPGKIYKVID
ncbi:MAG: DNA-protecting protein DprA [Flavobacteriales bacterium]|nr:DNA-protecting protein DprA [Flavobacteriales bacterium]